jgi:hypothetical protein
MSAWPNTNKRMDRLHADHAVFNGITYLIIYDAFSKLFEIYRVEGTNLKTTARAFNKFLLRMDIVIHWTPKMVRHSLPLICGCLHNFSTNHVLSPPWNLKINEAAECAVQTFKHFLEMLHVVEHKKLTKTQLQEKISEYLFTYRNTPSTVIDKTPS